MRIMLRSCEEFATSYDVLFNSSKSVSLVFNPPPHRLSPLFLNGDEIPKKETALHLGHTIGSGSDRINKRKAMSDLYAHCNILRSRFHFCNYDEKIRLFNSFCYSFYGSSLWRLQSLDQVSVCWRKCIRSMFHLSPLTHSRFIPHLLGKVDLKFDLLARFHKFFFSCANSSSNLVKCCIKRSIFNIHSPVSDNIRFLMSFLNVEESTLYDIAPSNIKRMVLAKWVNQHSADHTQNICQSIIELIKLRSQELSSVLSHDEVELLLYDLCVN